jgi:hypothetical protein
MADTEPTFERVDPAFRGAARGQWGVIIQALMDPDETIFVPAPEADRAKGSLVQAMRGRGKRLRSKSTVVNGKQGKVFWAEDKS